MPKTNNEILNDAYKDGYLGSVPVHERKTWEGKTFTYIADVSLTQSVPAYRGFVTGDKPVHLKSLGIVTSDEDVKIEVFEDATFTGGTEVQPIARNRKTAMTDYRDDFETMAFNTATALKHQPHVGEPVVRRVLNNGNWLYPAIAAEVSNLFTAYGVKINPVAQVDNSQGLQIAYKSKQVRTKYVQETITEYTVDVLKVLGTQSYDEGEPVIKAVYNDTNVLLTPTADYLIDEDESHDWGIIVVDGGGADPTKNIVVCYEVEEEYLAEFIQNEPAFEFGYQKLAIGTPTGTFEEGEVIIGGASEATGTIIKIDLVGGFLYINDVDGVFQNAETVTGDDSEAFAALTDDPEEFHWVEFEHQSHDDSAITATVNNGLRGVAVETLSQTLDYTITLDTTYKITLKETAKTSATKPVVVLYSVEDLISKGDGLKIYTGPTVTDDGTLIEAYLSSGGGDEWELILRPNAKYLIKGLTTVTQDVMVKYRWYLED